MRAIPYVAGLLEKGRWQDVDNAAIARVTAALSHLASNGGRLNFGSDTPSGPTFTNPPGLNGRLEMRRWSEAGVGPAQLSRAATLVNAEFYGLQEDLGTVEKGKRADLLLMSGNPLVDASAYDSIEIVILDGRVLGRAELSAQHRP